MQGYLAALQARRGVVARACEDVGIRANHLSKWRVRDSFRYEEQLIRETVAREDGTTEKLKAYAQNALVTKAAQAGLGEGLERWQRVFLLVYQETKDRVQACRAAETRWAVVKETIDKEPAFAAGVEEVEEELRIQLCDARRRRAIKTGDSAATNSIRKEEAAAAARNARPTESRRDRVERLRAGKAAVN